jgi:hypothetical protein
MTVTHTKTCYSNWAMNSRSLKAFYSSNNFRDAQISIHVLSVKLAGIKLNSFK